MFSRTRVLILCTGNSARSQMAEGLWRHLGEDEFEIVSAGTHPTTVRAEAITVMAELGIDISGHRSKSVEEFTQQRFDLVLTVCSDARENCPVFSNAAEHLHWNIDDPAAAEGDEEKRLRAFRQVRDELRRRIAAELALREPV